MARASFPRRQPPVPTISEVIGRWGATLRPAISLDHPTIFETAQDLAETLLDRPDEIAGALDRFGRRMGNDGWTLDDVAEWIDRLADAAGPAAGPLRSFEAGIALGQGWSAGFLRGLRDDGCTDALTGLATVSVLGLRLQQVHDQCAALGVDARQVYALVVIDVDLAGRPPLFRDAARVVVADRVAATFSTGETVCETGGPIVVLASRTPVLHAQLADLEIRIGGLAILESSPVLVWVEDLPDQPEPHRPVPAGSRRPLDRHAVHACLAAQPAPRSARAAPVSTSRAQAVREPGLQGVEGAARRSGYAGR